MPNPIACFIDALFAPFRIAEPQTKGPMDPVPGRPNRVPGRGLRRRAPGLY